MNEHISINYEHVRLPDNLKGQFSYRSNILLYNSASKTNTCIVLINRFVVPHVDVKVQICEKATKFESIFHFF